MSYVDDDGTWDSNGTFYPDRGKEHLHRDKQHVYDDYEPQRAYYSSNTGDGLGSPIVWLFILWLIFGS